eukprot:m.1221031 g.1221031  ORF g.1221031 m.1221031 type:complete len:122 (+) comp24624_c0_seq3:2005-2370(+)
MPCRSRLDAAAAGKHNQGYAYDGSVSHAHVRQPRVDAHHLARKDAILALTDSSETRLNDRALASSKQLGLLGTCHILCDTGNGRRTNPTVPVGFRLPTILPSSTRMCLPCPVGRTASLRRV